MKGEVYVFKELSSEYQPLAGGKGGTLAYLYQKGYPVPNGFIILPTAFENDLLTPESWIKVRACLRKMRLKDGDISFAIRSSALCEDSSTASFAGQFDTVLNLCTDEEVRKAIRTVRQSRHSNEVKVYSEVKGINVSDEMAVVVQQMAQADISGVLFTADPVTGSHNKMSGNFVFGLGEKLVSGQAKAYTFTLVKSKSLRRRFEYDGPKELKQFAGILYKLGRRLEKELGCPQDIEWSIVGGKLYLLQSRPITTLIGYKPETGDWNDSLTGDYLWSNVNFGEAIPNVMTPLSWTVQQFISSSWKLVPGYQYFGNIGGRPYVNLTIFASVLHAFGKKKKDTLKFLEGTLYTRVPDAMEIPLIPLPIRSKISTIINFIKIHIKQRQAIREFPQYLVTNPAWCTRMRERIFEVKNKTDLKALWYNEIGPHIKQGVWNVMGSVSSFMNHTMKLRRQLSELVGTDDADFCTGIHHGIGG